MASDTRSRRLGVRMGNRWLVCCLWFAWFSGLGLVDAGETENVILVTMDGFRWQELFGGADLRLMTEEAGKVERPAELRARYYRESAAERRKVLMPFFWSKIAERGQVYGDPNQDSIVRVTNDQQFSYPGYSELLCGFPDREITSNDKVPNRNVTVLEWLNRKAAYRGKVAAFTSWDVFPYIINVDRSGVYVNAGWQPLEVWGDSEQRRQLNALANGLPQYWAAVRYDAITVAGAIEYLKVKRPRVLYVALGETDDWAHAGRYDLYLDAARNNDRFIRELWETAASLPSHRGKTTLILTSDHGRGDGREAWKNHNLDTPGSDRIWIAAMGPDSERHLDVGGQYTQAQVAATVAGILAEDFAGSDARIAAPIQGVIGGN